MHLENPARKIKTPLFQAFLRFHPGTIFVYFTCYIQYMDIN
ncbi:hypothetical protein DCCM_2378 [Desulfocucumis palustris]|uniref:Uncharacterized protein n=1 Tax=Desulfocucumis palustris TaxID=1898651 RepID=A0A2L2XAI0_9FIRM|nr:hypothetical protein DCCM_2378 [Desulfocucumis palustris]